MNDVPTVTYDDNGDVERYELIKYFKNILFNIKKCFLITFLK